MSKGIMNDCSFDIWECLDFEDGNKNFDFFIEMYSPEVYLLLGISMVEVKPVVTGKDVVITEINQNCQESDARININDFAVEPCSESVRFQLRSCCKKLNV